MAVTVKSEKQIALMREAGRLLAMTHERLSVISVAYRISRIIMDFLLLSVYPSMMKLFTESLLIRES